MLCNYAAWCWLSAVAFHDACSVAVYNTIIPALDFVCNMIMATRETAISSLFFFDGQRGGDCNILLCFLHLMIEIADKL